MASGTQFALQALKNDDPVSHLSCLYLPENVRHAAAVIYAFDAEIRSIPRKISEPMPGELRIQWWKDCISGKHKDQSGPVAEALSTQIEKHGLQREVFWNCLEARIFDLYHDPMPDLQTLEGYLGETVSAVLLQVALVTGLDHTAELADACGHGGVAIGLSRILASQAEHRRANRVYIPLTILEKHDLVANSWIAGKPEKKHRQVLDDFFAIAEDHLEKARTSIAVLDLTNVAVFLPVAFAAQRLRKAKRAGVSVFTRPAEPSLLKYHLTALKTAITGKI